MLDQSVVAEALELAGDDAGSLGRGESGGAAPCPARDPPTSPLTRGSQARLSRHRTLLCRDTYEHWCKPL